MIAMQTGRKLRAWRKNLGRHQRDVAQAARMAQGVLSMIEQGQRDPSLEQAFKLEIVTDGHVTAREWVSTQVLNRVQPIGPEEASATA